MEIIENQTFDQERALYGSHDLTVRHCAFDGPALRTGKAPLRSAPTYGRRTAFITCATPSGMTITLSSKTEK